MAGVPQLRVALVLLQQQAQGSTRPVNFRHLAFPCNAAAATCRTTSAVPPGVASGCKGGAGTALQGVADFQVALQPPLPAIHSRLHAHVAGACDRSMLLRLNAAKQTHEARNVWGYLSKNSNRTRPKRTNQ